MMVGRHRGWGLAALGMLLVSTDSYFIRLSELDGWTVAFLVSVGSLPVQIGLQRLLEGGQPLTVFRRSPRGLLTVGVLSGVSQLCFVIAVTRTDIANVVVIVASAPIAAAIVGRLFFGERTSRRVWTAIFITVIGVVIVVLGSVGEPNLTGDLLAMGAVLCFSINMNVWRHYRDQSRYVGLAIAAAATILFSVGFADPFGHSAKAYLACAGMGLVFNPAGRLCHTSAPRYAPAAEVALFTPVETFAATTWAWIAFGDQPLARTFIGGAVVLIGLLYGTMNRVPPASTTSVLT